ncbi:MAG: hypothetical protein DMD34_00400, partial [Gemmatimonadetes bacterium]
MTRFAPRAPPRPRRPAVPRPGEGGPGGPAAQPSRPVSTIRCTRPSGRTSSSASRPRPATAPSSRCTMWRPGACA